ncbi:hypothetical protein [Micromonospora polyrhachis]|uniref:Uncharacterized protein n=1 Tax=Micromonospora polyrhachis TaxID=1282883 RepID=A0A7W7SMS5_9ACTN|nr:hypothetical protein [Micromonospora polyrhachis]MBB4957668.1 hypothetical protein [Micromonospora polyrhachis]
MSSALLTIPFAGLPASAATAQNAAPDVPAQLTTYPATACGSSTHPILWSASMADASFTARLSDPDGNNLAAHLEIRRASDGTVVYGPAVSAFVPSGSPVTWPAVPSGVLTADGTVYSYRARAQDSKGAYGPYTEDCYFSVDDIRPGAPGITSTDYPEGGTGVDAGTVGLVTITPATGDIDIAGYHYGFDDTVLLWAPADTTGTATIPITLWEIPISPDGELRRTSGSRRSTGPATGNSAGQPDRAPSTPTTPAQPWPTGGGISTAMVGRMSSFRWTWARVGRQPGRTFPPEPASTHPRSAGTAVSTVGTPSTGSRR